MRKQKGVFELYLEAMAKTGDVMLAWQYQKDMFKQSILDKEERQALIQDVAAEVGSHLSATVDISEALMEIDELRKAIDGLTK